VVEAETDCTCAARRDVNARCSNTGQKLTA